jgi:hypothetical protein
MVPDRAAIKSIRSACVKRQAPQCPRPSKKLPLFPLDESGLGWGIQQGCPAIGGLRSGWAGDDAGYLRFLVNSDLLGFSGGDLPATAKKADFPGCQLDPYSNQMRDFNN